MYNQEQAHYIIETEQSPLALLSLSAPVSCSLHLPPIRSFHIWSPRPLEVSHSGNINPQEAGSVPRVTVYSSGFSVHTGQSLTSQSVQHPACCVGRNGFYEWSSRQGEALCFDTQGASNR